jgi:hypothetical protein
MEKVSVAAWYSNVNRAFSSQAGIVLGIRIVCGLVKPSHFLLAKCHWIGHRDPRERAPNWMGMSSSGAVRGSSR